LRGETALLRDKNDSLERHATMAQEFEHRLVNNLQLIVSVLSLQSRAATTPEAATQLKIAANRVAALGRVHRQLHLLDHQQTVEFKQYIQHLCEEFSGLLFEARSASARPPVKAARKAAKSRTWMGSLGSSFDI
jgi:two-component system, sensor histidine kinase PdtaS